MINNFRYEEGQGVKKDAAIAAYWYKLSALQGYPWAQCNWAYLLQNGLGVEEDTESGAYWYRKAALQGHSRFLEY
jgi:TPR repeat protein